MRNFSLLIGTLSLTALALPGAHAADKSDGEDLKNLQTLLANPNAVREFAKGNKDALGALDQVNELTKGNQAQQVEINNIGSTILSDMDNKSNHDPMSIESQLQQALKDPKAFLQALPPEQQARIRNLASDLDKQNAAKTAPATK